MHRAGKAPRRARAQALPLNRFFSDSYAEARSRFLEAAAARGARIDTLPLELAGPDGAPLSIDIAWLGAASPRSVLVHSSGLHGVEGFAGSAIQASLLERGVRVPRAAAVALIHVLNPYGMAWLRRTNENNVDLNRNFLFDDAGRTGASPAYRRLDPLLNPPGVPARDFFYLRAGLAVLRHGLAPLRQAIAEGQYEFPRGLFYGGARLERGPALLVDWIRTCLASTERIGAIDVHTGLGPWAHGSRLAAERPAPGIAYSVRGGYAHAYDALPRKPELIAVTQEFGTYSSLRVLHALREENRLHHYGEPTLAHPAKLRLLEAFAPASAAWRRSVLAQGAALFDETLARLD